MNIWSTPLRFLTLGIADLQGTDEELVEPGTQVEKEIPELEDHMKLKSLSWKFLHSDEYV